MRGGKLLQATHDGVAPLCVGIILRIIESWTNESIPVRKNTKHGMYRALDGMGSTDSNQISNT